MALNGSSLETTAIQIKLMFSYSSEVIGNQYGKISKHGWIDVE